MKEIHRKHTEKKKNRRSTKKPIHLSCLNPNYYNYNTLIRKLLEEEEEEACSSTS
jgi:hypothetical protein